MMNLHVNSLTANRKLLKVNPPLTSVTGDHHNFPSVKGAFPPEMCYATLLEFLYNFIETLKKN
uniref:SFRICE_007009 n=1 Tax=Spodoptera frugiperda TaxID=7108 RepID=A0A2H1VRG1_SPOFR